ncbi:VTC domain-containing protein [Pilibacter termitis]|uniref:VTC domain-containing protein n=1 Tax=Pilibacter termitis TaxID=263852 RepID=A0A1T4L0H8_9ENTE|nr:polyphosphate polymerase domain-containing protein [Pilibacter termitis]SJZ48205.1 VTC domain-containing protein [Pilibacter termitis]
MAKKVRVKEGQIFERKEKKYVLTKEQFEQLVAHLTQYMSFDDYGEHTIHTVYYDTTDYDVIRHSVSKPRFKEKLRLRSYGKATYDGEVFLELKKKVAGVTYKRREKMPYCEAIEFLSKQGSERKTQILNEIGYHQRQFSVKPVVLISYDRLAMYHKKDSDFRITFDKNIRYSLSEFDLTRADDIDQTALTDSDTVLMEIKISDSFPLEISRILSLLDIYQGKFTKYGNIYKSAIAPNYYEGKLKQMNTKEMTRHTKENEVMNYAF